MSQSSREAGIHHVHLRDFPAVDYLTVRDAYFKLCEEHFRKLGIPHFPNVMMGWDPTPRLRPDQKHTGKGYPDTPVVTGNTPARFRDALAEAKARAAKFPPTQRVVTIYAWNEWSEGGYLEPGEENKFAYLEAIQEVFMGKPR